MNDPNVREEMALVMSCGLSIHVRHDYGHPMLNNRRVQRCGHQNGIYFLEVFVSGVRNCPVYRFAQFRCLHRPQYLRGHEFCLHRYDSDVSEGRSNDKAGMCLVELSVSTEQSFIRQLLLFLLLDLV